MYYSLTFRYEDFLQEIIILALTQLILSVKKIIFIFLIFAFAQNLRAQEQKQCPCCSEAHQAFDFWIGDWTVYDTEGNIVGKNTIEKQYSNCVLQEKWVSSGISQGTSYNYYNKNDQSWHQLWLDNSGFSLSLKGNYKEDKMIMSSDLLKGKNGDYYNQITWTKNKDGSVTQVWELLNDKHIITQEAFRGIYKKSVKTP